VVLYGFETWSLTLREEHRLRVFKNRVLRRIIGPKRDEVTEERRKLHNKELHDLYCLPCIIRIIISRIRWEGHIARMEKRAAYRFIGRKARGKRPLGRLRRRWVNNIKMYRGDMGWGIDWLSLSQNSDKSRAIVNTVWTLISKHASCVK
jgi:hypothetical protein